MKTVKAYQLKKVTIIKIGNDLFYTSTFVNSASIVFKDIRYFLTSKNDLIKKLGKTLSQSEQAVLDKIISEEKNAKNSTDAL